MTTSSQLRSIVFVRLSSAEKIACWIQLSMKYFSTAALRRKDNRMIQQLVINVINAYFAYWWVGVRLLICPEQGLGLPVPSTWRSEEYSTGSVSM